MPGKQGRIPIERQIWLRQQLLAVKAKLPHSHFRAWVEEKSGLTWSQASRFVKLAKETPQQVAQSDGEQSRTPTIEPETAGAHQRADMGQIAA
jgi:hypothetical protein